VLAGGLESPGGFAYEPQHLVGVRDHRHVWFAGTSTVAAPIRAANWRSASGRIA